MWSIKALAINVTKLNEDDVYSKVVNTPEVKREAVRLNTQVQLYERGENTLGQKMRSFFARFGRYYADFTINEKQIKSQVTDRVTLRDTGAFYNTFKARFDGELKLTADTNKDGEDLQDTWGQVVGLNEDTKSELVKTIKPKVIDYVKSKVLG